MNRKIWAGIACASLLVVTSGCSEEKVLLGNDEGRISLNLDFNPSPVKGPRAERSRADESAGNEENLPVTESDLSLTLSREDGINFNDGSNVLEFTTDDFSDGALTVYTGDYTLEASFGSAEDEGWDSPYYYGSQQLTVAKDTETEVSLPVRLANAIVNITYSDGFTSYLDDYKVTITSSTGNDFEWDDELGEDITHDLYVSPGTVLLTVDITKPNGNTATVQLDTFEAQEQHKYNVTLDIDYQSETLTVTTDDTVDTREVELDISDANLPQLAAKPIILTGEGFTPGANINIVSSCKSPIPLKSTIVARGTIASAKLSFTSSYLTSRGLTSPIELTEDNPILSELGLETHGLIGNRDVFATLDFSNFVSNIPYVEDEDNTSSFSLTVTDANGTVCKPVDLFTLNVNKLIIEIRDGSEILEEGMAKIILRYNGDSVDDVKIQGHNDRGTTEDLTITSCKPGTVAGTYNMTVTSPLITWNTSLNVHALAGKNMSYDFTLDVPPIRLVDTEISAFAKHAYVTVLFTSDEATAHKDNVRFDVSSNGGNTYTRVKSVVESTSFSARATYRTAVYKLTGLNPNTDYVFHAILDDESTDDASFTTEDDKQLENGTMEDWYSTEVYTKTQWSVGTTGMTDIVRWFPYKENGQSKWATRNALTTGQTSGTTCYYTSFSGTIPVDGVTGKAAEISTLGYGEGTAYAHTKSGVTGSPKRKAVGMLFNGLFENDTPIFGIPFTSRPVSLSFQYKYIPVNNESFTAYIVVEHRENGTVTELGRGEIISDAKQDSFTLKNVPIKYENYSLKATHIYTVFKSSTLPDDNTTVLSVQGKKNALNGYSDSKYVGSVLTVDDITLNY